jgi:hypothetical protein
MATEMENVNLRGYVQLVRDAREAARLTTEARTELEEKFRAENAAVFEADAADKKMQAECEATLREQIVAAFEKTGDKKPGPGCGVRVAETQHYLYDEKTAFEWAKLHDLGLMLDRDFFEGICESPSRPGFVTVETEKKITATIAKDLDAALAEAGS